MRDGRPWWVHVNLHLDEGQLSWSEEPDDAGRMHEGGGRRQPIEAYRRQGVPWNWITPPRRILDEINEAVARFRGTES